MDATYLVTPEMLGLTWRSVLRQGLKRCAIAGGLWMLYSFWFHRPVFSDVAVGGLLAVFLSALLIRPLSRTRLRITDESLETSDGPVIRQHAIARVTEYSDGNFRGIEVVGAARPRWLRDYRIFVPAALPEYPQIRQIIERWVPAQTLHRA